jgi:histidinol-phosphatase
VDTAWKTRYELAIEGAENAGKLAMSHFDCGVTVEWKADESPVTIADRQAEHLLRDVIRKYFPNDGLLGEEHGEEAGSSGYRWIIDPIDGTRSFVRGVPIWGTLIGLEYQGELIAGVARVPPLGVTYRALRGDGAFRDNRRLHVSNIDQLAQAQLFYSGINWFHESGCIGSFLEFAGATQRQRGFGDFYGFVLVAQGSGEFMIDHGVHAWDIAALKPIVEEAGGSFSNWDGGFNLHSADVIASNGKLHAAAVQAMSKNTSVKPARAT